MKRLFLISIFIQALAASFFTAKSQLIINEVMPVNTSGLVDEGGDYNDWIEIWNKGNTAVNLAGYGLSDNEKQPFKWTFATRNIAPGEHLVVMASGKNIQANPLRPDSIPGLLAWLSAATIDTTDANAVVKQNNKWLVRRWNSQNATLYASQTVLSASPELVVNAVGNRPALRFDGTSQFLKTNIMAAEGNKPRTFIILVSNANNVTANQHTTNYFFQYGYYDNAYGGYFQGQRYGSRIGMHYWNDSFVGDSRMDAGSKVITFCYDGKKDEYYVNGKLGGTYYTTLATEKKEPLNIASRIGAGQDFFGGDMLEFVVIDRALSPAMMRRVENFLAQRNGLPVTSPHTNFKVSSSSETLTLAAPGGAILDRLTIPASALTDISYGRINEQAGWFSEPTPGKANADSYYSGIAEPPLLSHPTGWYSDSLLLSMVSNDPQASVLYTLDGSVPHPDALNGKSFRFKNEFSSPGPGVTENRMMTTYRYERPVSIKPFADNKGNLANIKASATEWIPTGNPVPRATVVRAAVWKEGQMMSPVVTSTYLVDTLPEKRYRLPVMSVTMSEESLFSYDKGIYTLGKYYDETRNTANPDANYKRSEFEEPAHFALIDTEGKVEYESNAGVKIHGKFSVMWPRKSLNIRAQRKYGAPSQYDHEFFPGLQQKKAVGDAPIRTFNKFNLRNSGIQWDMNLFHDAYLHRLFDHKAGDFQASRPVVHLLNGEYWGIMNLREDFDRYYFSEHYSMHPDEVVIVNPVNQTVNEGYDYELNDYTTVELYAVNTDLSNAANYSYFKTKVDIESYLYHFMTEIYSGNTDFIDNNRKVWKKRTNGYLPGAPYGHDGRWRWISYDYDLTLRHPWKNCLREITVDNTHLGTAILRKLLLNREARDLFINQFCDLMNTSMLPPYAGRVFDTMAAEMSHDLEVHRLRWMHPLDITQQKDTTMQFIYGRPAYMYEHLRTRFDLSDTVRLTVNTNPEQGRIRVNAISIDEHTPRAVEGSPVYPWSGVYFRDVPVRLEALPAEGYQFSEWSNGSKSTILNISLQNAMNITAHFEKAAAATEQVVINEINYNSLAVADPGDWIELFNPNEDAVSLAGWYVKDESGTSYVFPESTTMDPKGFLVLAENKQSFLAFNKDVVKLYGNAGFGLSGSGETIQLYDRHHRLIDQVTYSDKLPWPKAADGEGAVLALKDYKLDNNEGGNWFADPHPGTPGFPNMVPTEEEPEVGNRIKVYPVPANDRITLLLPEDFTATQLKVYTLTGQAVMHIELAADRVLTVDISHLSQGLYVMEHAGLILVAR